MQKCTYCGADTELLVNGIPMCLDCDKKREARTPAAIALLDVGKRQCGDFGAPQAAIQEHSQDGTVA